MFRPEKISMLLKERNLTNKELLNFIGKNYNGSLQTIIKGDIGVSKLEKIADFFGVPTDYFFTRENSRAPLTAEDSLKESKENLMTLIEEKDKRIKNLEEIISLLKEKIER